MEHTVVYENPIPVEEPVLKTMCYSISEIELILGISRPSVLKLLNKNEFKWFKIGTVYRMSKPSFEEWMQKHCNCQGCRWRLLAGLTS